MYYQPDITWQSFNIQTQEEYVKSFVVKGNFHTAVHKDVLKSYKTVEYLMAHAYYHYPMYDEALKKLLSIFEMAVKLRCTDLDIELEFVNRRGKTQKKILAKLITDLIDYGYPVELKSSLDWVRRLRNMSAHPDSHSFGGGIFKGPIIPILNIINSIFKAPIDVAERKIKIEHHQKEMESLLNKVYILNHNKQAILVYNPTPVKAMKIKNNWVYAWHIHPVLANTKKLLEEHKIPSPIVLFLKDENIIDNNLSAFDLETNSKTKLSITTKPENIKNYKKHISEFEALERMDQFAYESSHNSTITTKIDNFVYKHCWKSKIQL